MSVIISPDEVKKTLRGYLPSKAELFHAESAHIADRQLTEELKRDIYTDVILLSGGSASGKTEFLLTQLFDLNDIIVVDTTLSNVEGAKIKIRNSRRKKKNIRVYSVIPDNLYRAFLAFLNRDRKFLEISIIESSYTKDNNLKFELVNFTDKKQLIKFLEDIQLTELDIMKIVNSELVSKS